MRWVVLLCLGMLVGLGGCATSRQDVISLDVPFVAQEPSQCGVAALEMVFAYYDVAAEQRPDATQAYFSTLGGCPPEMMAHLAAEAGLSAAVRSAEPDALADWIRQGRPVIALWQAPDEAVGHYVVVTGMDRNGRAFRIHSGDSSDRRVSRLKFMDRWAASGFTAVLIGPAETRDMHTLE